MKVRCQICGRSMGRRQDGTVKLHHVKSDECPGTGRLPWELSCDAIDEKIAVLTKQDAGWRAWLTNYYKGNMPPADAEFQEMCWVSDELRRLQNRRKRWDKRNWREYYYGEDDKGMRPPTEEEAAAYTARFSMAA